MISLDKSYLKRYRRYQFMDSAKLERKIATADRELREILTAAIDGCSKKRLQIAEEMSVHAGQKISKAMLDHWTATSHATARFPASLVQSFCVATDDDTLQRHVMGMRLRGIIELREEQMAWLAESLKPKPRRPNKAKGKRPRKS